MTRGNRRTHLAMWLVLGPLAFALLAAALVAKARTDKSLQALPGLNAETAR